MRAFVRDDGGTEFTYSAARDVFIIAPRPRFQTYISSRLAHWQRPIQMRSQLAATRDCGNAIVAFFPFRNPDDSFMF